MLTIIRGYFGNILCLRSDNRHKYYKMHSQIILNVQQLNCGQRLIASIPVEFHPGQNK